MEIMVWIINVAKNTKKKKGRNSLNHFVKNGNKELFMITN
jgi:hypothetical protein